jgi:hypothetical protein
MDKHCQQCPLRTLQETCGARLQEIEVITPPTRLMRIGQKISTIIRNWLPNPNPGTNPPHTCNWGSDCREQALQRIGNAAAHGFSLTQCDLSGLDKEALLQSLPPASDYYDIPSMRAYFQKDSDEIAWQKLIQELEH